jgi:hypothetical protein
MTVNDFLSIFYMITKTRFRGGGLLHFKIYFFDGFKSIILLKPLDFFHKNQKKK